MAISVGIIGLGNISQGYDTPGEPTITTHIKACLSEPRLRLKWVADVNLGHAESVRRRWGLDAKCLPPEALLAENLDVLCIASPDATHGDYIRAALQTSPRLILCEKPLAASAGQALDLIGTCEKAGTTLVVNFVRRWLPGVQEWLAAARGGAFGEPAGATGVYCRGLVHNACHNLDLIGAAFGADGVEAECVGVPFLDYSDSDSTVSVQMSVRAAGRRVPILLTGVDGRVSNQWAVDIMFQKGRLRIWNDDGIRLETYAPASDVAAYAPELRSSIKFHDKPARYMELVWRNIADHLANGAALHATAHQNEEGLRLLERAATAR